MSMIVLFSKMIASFKQIGLQGTLIRMAQYPFRGHFSRRRRELFESRVLSAQNIEERFTEIYKMNYWGSHESVSGYGSTLENTENIRALLPELFRKFNIRSVFDAPCGDFNWMSYVLEESEISYTGGDIVRPLVEQLNAQHGNSRIKFVHVDLTDGEFPHADMMICRDCFLHLSFRDTKKVLQNFIGSGIPLLLTTTYVNNGQFANRDIATGDARGIDLFAAPYNFDKDVLFRIEDPKTPTPVREMCLWTREQISLAVRQFEC